MNESILQTESLTKKVTAAAWLLTVSRCQLSAAISFGFLGQNGAGKSTVIRMALGLVRPTRGRVLLFGHDMARASATGVGPRGRHRGSAGVL